MLTVREALSMPVFSDARLIAGQAGVDREIRWVHVVDIPDANYQWSRKGVLVLTAGFGLRGDPERQAALIPHLEQEGFAGMVLSTSYYLDRTPDVMCEAADRLNFPIIEAPPELLFIEITEDILGKIINRQYATLQEADRIHRHLTELVLRGGGLSGLARTLAELLQRSVSIEDPALQVMAAARHGSVDEARKKSESAGRTTPETARHLLDSGIYQQLLVQQGPIRVPPIPEYDMDMERFVAPILVDGDLYGYIWIISGDRPLTDLDELAIRHGATIAALILFKEQAVREAEEALRGDFLEQLLRGQDAAATFTRGNRRLNYRPDRPHQVLLIHGPPKAGGTIRSLYTELERWLEEKHETALVVWRDPYLVAIVEARSPDTGVQLAESMVAAFKHPARQLLVGVGESSVDAENDAEVVRRSYETAHEALQVARALGHESGVATFEELGLLHWLYHMPPERRLENTYLRSIQTLADYDVSRRTELVKTLDIYLDCGGSLVEAARQLYVHRNTILHRLERIQEIGRLDLKDPLQRLNLHAAIKLFFLNRTKD